MRLHALIFKADFADRNQAYIWFNRRPNPAIADYVIAVDQAEYQTDTEQRLLAAVQQEFPTAYLHTDTTHPGEYRCIRIK